jgi:hypothetical protein
MRKRNAILWVFVTAVALGGGAGVTAQQVVQGHEWCQDESWGDDRAGYCEVRQFTLPASGMVLAVDASPNGGIKVEGMGRGDIQVLAKVVGTAPRASRAREIVNAVRVNATADRVDAEGPPRSADREGWHVSYRIEVPERTGLSLRSVNGGIAIDNVSGKIDFRTTNGGVNLTRVGGDVRGRTTNGGVDVDLDGSTWDGEGLDVETSNGGVKLAIPANYSANLETGTVNGRLNLDFPVTVQGRLNKNVSATLGSGGPYIRVRTSNGGVRISRK